VDGPCGVFSNDREEDLTLGERIEALCSRLDLRIAYVL